MQKSIPSLALKEVPKTFEAQIAIWQAFWKKRTERLVIGNKYSAVWVINKITLGCRPSASFCKTSLFLPLLAVWVDSDFVTLICQDAAVWRNWSHMEKPKKYIFENHRRVKMCKHCWYESVCERASLDNVEARGTINFQWLESQVALHIQLWCT